MYIYYDLCTCTNAHYNSMKIPSKIFSQWLSERHVLPHLLGAVVLRTLLVTAVGGWIAAMVGDNQPMGV